MSHLTANLAPSWSTLVRKCTRPKDKKTSSRTLIYAYGKTTPSIMYTMTTQLRSSSMRILRNLLYGAYLKVIMLPFWHMDRLELVKHTLWRDLSTLPGIHKEVLFLDQWKKYLGLSRCNLLRTQPLWCVHHTCRSTTK